MSTDNPKRGDRVYTPYWAARDMVEYFKPRGLILEPCRGDGALTKYLNDISGANVSWCEIDEGRDFFAWSDDVDWIITNPPYSKLRPFMKHAFRLADDVVFLVPARNVFSGYGTVREACPAFGMKAIRWYGTGNKLGFPMGNAIAAIHWSRGYTGGTVQTFFEDSRN